MTILFVFPHPDDETIFTGGMMARHVAKGDSVIWVCASYGERGGESRKRSPRFFYLAYLLFGYFPFLMRIQNLTIWWLSIFRKPNKSLVKTRKSEAEKVAAIYGLQPPHFLEIPDMQFRKNENKIIERIKHHINLYKPQKIYSLHPNGITRHPDHVALNKCIVEAIRDAKANDQPELYGATIPERLTRKLHLPLFGVPESEISKEIKLTAAELAKKLQAINAYKSQNYLWKIFLKKYPELLEKEYFIKLA